MRQCSDMSRKKLTAVNLSREQYGQPFCMANQRWLGNSARHWVQGSIAANLCLTKTLYTFTSALPFGRFNHSMCMSALKRRLPGQSPAVAAKGKVCFGALSRREILPGSSFSFIRLQKVRITKLKPATGARPTLPVLFSSNSISNSDTPRIAHASCKRLCSKMFASEVLVHFALFQPVFSK